MNDLRMRAIHEVDEDLRATALEAMYRRYRVSSGRDDHYCPLCRCNKSGREDVPNQFSEAHDDIKCPCHDGFADEWNDGVPHKVWRQ